MSDISIPGFNSDSNSAKMIENLLKAERIPLEKMESEQEEYVELKGLWQDLKVTLSKLSDSSNKLYGFENPFNEKTITSTNEDILTAETERSAIDENLSFTVKQLATTDKFVSKQLDEDYRIPKGTYKFSIGEEDLTLKYRGGDVEDFVTKLNKKSPEELRASLIKNSKTTQVLLLESLITGSENSLGFHDDSIPLALDTGLIEENVIENSRIPVDDLIESEGIIDTNKYNINLSPSSRVSFRVDQELNKTDHVEITVELKKASSDKNKPELLNDLQAPSITLDNITINSETGGGLERFEKSDTDETDPILDMNIVSIKSDNTFDFELEPLVDIYNKKQTLTFTGEDIKNLKSINITNNNSNKVLVLHSATIKKGAGSGDYVPVKPITIAENAEIEMNGMLIERETNEIDDLVDGTKLYLHKADPDEEVSLAIEFDTEYAKDQILDFVYNYNQSIQKILILTTDDSAVISEIEFADDTQKEKAEEIQGLLKGDRTLNSIKQNLQRTLSNVYPTDDDSSYNMLNTIGISTNATGSTDYSAARLRGYIEADLEKLDAALNNDIGAVKDLFGMDTNNDFIIDTGVAKLVDDLIKPYTRIGGTIATRVSTIDSQMKRNEDDIEDYKDHLITYEETIRRKYGAMDATINSLNSSMSAIESLTNNGDN